MTKKPSTQSHSAEAAALGFYYQSLFGLLLLFDQDTDDAAVAVENLDDVEIAADGQKLLFQLKHSMSAAPPKITIKSRAVWRTTKVWTDILPQVSLSETTFNLVTVGGIPKSDPLQVLNTEGSDRTKLADALIDEAKRVVKAREAAKVAGKKLPHSDRIDGCRAFLDLTKTERTNLLRRILIQQDSLNIAEIEAALAQRLDILPSDQRDVVARRLIEWWDRQVIYSLCGKRAQVIHRSELQQETSTIIKDIEQGKLVPDFETVSPPGDYQPDGMLTRQIRLVNGMESDLSKAIREEWRAREQRSLWVKTNPAMASKINDYDRLLQEHWADEHQQASEECCEASNDEKCASGLKILRWTHGDAQSNVRPISEGWNAAYYIRGSYQVLAINLKVGWHPDYLIELGADE